MIFLFSSNVLKQHDRRLDAILKTSYLLIMISLSLCKPKTISLLVKLKQIEGKKVVAATRFRDRPGIYIRIFRDKSFMPVIRNSFFPP